MPAGPDAVRRAVLDAAAALFVRDGVAQVTLREIATAAQVNLGLISRYIGSRDELIRAVFADLSEQLAEEIRTSPTASRGFDDDTVMVRWTRVLTYLTVVDPDVAVEIGSLPFHELHDVIERVYGLSDTAARLRTAQIMALALGWRLYEPYLVDAAELDRSTLDEIRAEVTRTNRRIGATPLPSPADPPLRG